MTNNITAPIIGLNRHRILTDGKGITTLVGFYGCPLRCKYCLNPQSISPDFTPEMVSVDKLIEKLYCDDLYFRATGGGVCFSGGEPLLYSEFIKEFRLKCPEAWNIYIETSLNVPLQAVQAVEGIINGWIIDIKDMNHEIYTEYTGKGNELVISNLKYISSKRWSTPLKIRVPAIPNFNGYHDLRHSEDMLNSLGYNFEYLDEEFTYIQSREDHYADKKTSGIYFNENIPSTGKAVCSVLKEIRKQIAALYEFEFISPECNHKGNCKGSCPMCENELRSLSRNHFKISATEQKAIYESAIENMPKNIRKALTTSYEKSEPFITDGLFPRPQLYSISKGPLQGDINPDNL